MSIIESLQNILLEIDPNYQLPDDIQQLVTEINMMTIDL